MKQPCMNKIISRAWAQRLLLSGKATELTLLKPDDRYRRYVAIDRYDLQRTDHYLATESDVLRLGAMCKAEDY